MENISPVKPSFAFGYWRPWKEDSNFFDSYYNYTKDVSLAKYSADTVGAYISQASDAQVYAINQFGDKIGQGMAILSEKMESGFNGLAIQLDETNEQLSFINQNLNLQIEQQIITNILLEDISKLLRVPNSEKERQHHIELGLKFLSNSAKDEDLFGDALEELLAAQELMKQDYFVLHRIGMIYLYANKYIDPIKALDYFKRAGKYASVESDPKAARLANILRGKTQNDSIYSLGEYDVILKLIGQSKLEVVKIVMDILGVTLQEGKHLVDDGLKVVKVKASKNEAENIKSQFEKAGATVEIVMCTNSNFGKEQKEDLESINWLAADSYGKAAFAAYIIGDFAEAVSLSEKAKKYLPSAQNIFMLAKYQIRNGMVEAATENLNIAIDMMPELANACFSELDLINEPKILQLLDNKNNIIISKIQTLINDVESKTWDFYEVKYAEILNSSIRKDYTSKVEVVKEVELNLEIDAEVISLAMDIKNNIYPHLLEESKNGFFSDLKKFYPTYSPIQKRNYYKNYGIPKTKISLGTYGFEILYIDSSGKHGLMSAHLTPGLENNLVTWDNAMDYCRSLKYYGHSDWRLLSQDDIDLFAKTKFPQLPSYQMDYEYWTSIEKVEKTFFKTIRTAKIVHFKNGHQEFSLKENKYKILIVRSF